MALGKRIMIIGSGGSGKSTLARQLHTIIGLPLIHLDKEFWQTGWVETPRQAWIEKQSALIAGNEWIIDGNYSSTMDLRMEKADTVIFLDINHFVCVLSAVKRRIQYAGKTRPDLHEGCPEKIDFEFIKWIWQFPKVSRSVILKKLEQNKHKHIITLKSRGEVRKFLAHLRKPA